MADVAHVNTTTQTNTSASTTITVNVPTHSDGDLLIVYLCHAEAEDGDWTDVTSQSWALQVTELQVGQTPPSIPGVTIATRYADSEPASYTFTNDFSSGLLAVMSAYSGVNPDTPMDATPTTAQSSSTGDPNSPSITTQTDAAVVISVGIADATGTLTAAPTNYTNRAHLNNGTGGNGHTLSVSDRSIATAGAEDPGAYNFSQNEEWGAVTLAIANGTVTGIDPTTFDMDESSVTITGTDFNATQGSGTVYLSDADTLAGSDNEVDIDSAISSWSDISISLNLGNLSAAELIDLHRLGPGQRYLIVTTSTPAEFPSEVLTLYRPEAFVISLSSNFAPGTTTAQLTAPATKTTGDMDGGRIEEAANPSATNTDVTLDDYREDEWCFKQNANARRVAYEFRTIYTETAGITYAETPYLALTAATNIKVRVADFSLRTTNGTQDVTITDLGSASDIKGALFFCSNAVVLDTVAAHARHSLGGSDKTSTFNIFSGNEDNVSTTDVERKSHNNGIAIFLSDEAATTLVSVTIDSWITNGVRLDVTNPSSNAYKGYIVFFADSGSDLEIDASWQAMDNANDVDITTIGFEPEVVFGFSNGLNTNNSRTTDVKSSQGMLHNTGGVARQPQAALGLNQENGLTTTTEVAYVSDDSFILKLEDALFNASAHAKDFDSSGFTLDPFDLNSDANFQYFLSITTNGKIPLGLAQFTGPTSASVDWELLDTSITPQAVVAVQTACTVINSLRSTDEISSSAYAFDKDGAQASIGLASDSGETTVSNTCSFASTANTLWLRRDDQTADFHLAGDPSIVPGGFKFPASEITTADSTARYGFALIFGEGIEVEAGDVNVNANTTTFTLTTYPASIALDIDVQTNTDTYTLTTYQANVALDIDVQTNTDTYTLTTYQADIVYDVNVQANTDTYILATYQADIALDVDVQANTDTYTLTTYQADIVYDVDVQVGTQAFSLTAYSAEIIFDVNVQANAQAFTLTEYPAAISFDVVVQAGTQGFTLATYPAEITLDVDVQANTQAFTLTTYQANIEVGDDVNIQANTQAFTLTTYQADISLDVNVLTNIQAFTLTTYPASLGLGTNIQANTQAFTLTSYPAEIIFDVNVQANTQAFTLDTYQALVSSDRNVSCQTANFNLTTYQADIFAGTPSGTSEIITGRQMIADPADTSFPIQLAVNESGGVPGLTVLVELRDMDATTFFLDFDDYIMKSSGWVSKSQALSDNGGGYYSTSVDVAGISGLTGNHMSVEYEISGSVVGVSNSLLTLDSLSIEGTYNLQESVRLMLASLAGDLSGAGTTTVTIRDTGDTKDRIIATVDSNGNRAPVTLDAS